MYFVTHVNQVKLSTALQFYTQQAVMVTWFVVRDQKKYYKYVI